ncbi:glutathione transferase [Aureococcus anophagefferens]|nr:glutathione transferase [Aureococcus anophagefferens]
MAGQDTNMQGEAYWQYLRGAVDDLRIYDVALDAAGVAAVAADARARPPLVAHYSFDDGTATEDSDSSLDGTITGATATTGLFGSGALSFDGSNDYAEFLGCHERRLGSAPRTLCLWALRRGGGALASYGGDDDGPTGSAFGLGFTGDAFETWFRGDTRTHVAVVAGEGAWHHYCPPSARPRAPRSTSTATSPARAPAEPLVTLDDEPLRVGAWTKAGYEFDGVVDGFELHEVALGPARVRALYESTTAVMPPSAAPSSAPTIAPTAAPSTSPTPAPTAAPSTSPTVSPTIAPTAAPTVGPTASSLTITSVGAGDTCVANLACEVTWDYVGDPSKCPTIEAVLKDSAGSDVARQILENDGVNEHVVPGDALVNEYTMTLTCEDDSSLTSSYAFDVSFTPAPTAAPTIAPTAAPTADPSAGAHDRADARPRRAHGRAHDRADVLAKPAAERSADRAAERSAEPRPTPPPSPL